MKKLMDQIQEKLIGFEAFTCEMALSCSYGIKHMNKVVPYTTDKKAELLREFQLIASIQNKTPYIPQIISSIQKLKDLSGVVERIHNEQLLDLIDLYELKMQAIVMNELKDLLDSHLEEIEFKLGDLTSVILSLSEKDKPVVHDFYLYSGYSKKLTDIRSEKRKIEQLYYKSIDEVEKDKYKKMRSTYVILEEEEELKIRKTLTKELTRDWVVLSDNIEKIGHLDALIMKANIALRYGGCAPMVTEDSFYLEEFFHPVIKAQVNEVGQTYTANTLTLYKGTTIITGANMSGKSSVLKSVLFNVLLMHLGFYVFAKSAQLPLFDGLSFISSELETERHGLSSFGNEMMQMNAILSKMKEKRCLVCVDEFAKSTNPNEGQKFVKAFSNVANHLSSFTLLSTHYDGVVTKDFHHFQIAGLKKNFIKMDSIQDIHHYMDYTLREVTETESVPKEAYQVAILLGIDPDLKAELDRCYEE